MRNELVEEDGRIVAPADGRDRGDPVRARAAQRRLQRRGAAGRAVRRAERRDPERARPGRRARQRTYVAGWIKRGPSGVIGTNKKDATETVELLLEDARAGLLARAGDGLSLEGLLDERGATFVDYAGWEAIDAAERGAGEPHGRPRVKLDGAGTSCCRPAEDPRVGDGQERGFLLTVEPASRANLFAVTDTASTSEFWGGETRKAIANFPVSGEPIPTPVARWLGRIKAAAARVNAELGLLDAEKAERIAAAGDRVAARRARRPVPDRRLPDRLGHLVEHERERGDRDPRRRGRARERRRQHGPDLERRLPVGGAPRRARRDRPRPAARARPARRGARGEGGRVRRRRQVGPDALDGRGAGDARPGVRRLRGAGARGHGARRGDARAARQDPARRHRRRHRA